MDNNIVAHRGWHNKLILENTMEAFEKAYENGLYGIEFDMRWTKDLVPIIHHDESCKRVFKKKIRVNDLTFAELREIEPLIPSLEEVIIRFGKKIHLFIEFKDKFYPSIGKQRLILEKLLSNLVACEDYHFLSLAESQFKLFDNFIDQSKIFVAELNMRKLSKLSCLNNYGGITGHYYLLTNKILQKHKLLSQKIGTGFVKNQGVLQRETKREVDWIFTDHPWRLL